MQSRIQTLFNDSLKVKQASQSLIPDIEQVAQKMIDCLQTGGKILTCGNGGSAGDALHFSSELLNRFERERQPLAAIALTADNLTLTAIANDYGYEQVFAKQVQALGRAGDILLSFSTSGHSANVVTAMQVAQTQGLFNIGFTGKKGGNMAKLLHNGLELRVPSDSTARIQEVHLLLIHCLCDLIEQVFIGEKA